MSEVSIYVLIDPRTEKFFYVGSTKNAEYRHVQHKKYSSSSLLMRSKIKSIHDAGLDFRFVILDTCCHDDRDNREMYWIRKLTLEGQSLLNFKKPNFQKINQLRGSR